MRTTDAPSIRPVGKYVLIERDKHQGTTAAGILLSESQQKKERPWRGTVLAIGAGALDKEGERVPPQVKPGDKVVFQQWTGHRFLTEGDDQDQLLVAADDILGVFASPT